MMTQKKEMFCLEFVQCGNASEAYRKAFDTSKMKEESVWTKASALMKDVEVRSRIDELNKKTESSAIMTVEERKKILTKIANSVAFDKYGNEVYTDARGAIDLLNKMDAVYVEKKVLDHKGAVNIFVPEQDEDV